MYDNFIRALQALKNLLPYEARNNFAVYEARLMENLHRAQFFGDTETLRSDRAAIIDGLNRLANSYGVTSFNDLSYSDQAIWTGSRPPSSATVAEPTNSNPNSSQQTVNKGIQISGGVFNAEQIVVGDQAQAFKFGQPTQAKRDKPLQPTPPDLQVTLLTRTVPTAYYHYLDAERFPLVKVLVDNSGSDCDDVALTISTFIEGYSDTSTTSLRVKKGERKEEALLPLLQASAMRTLKNVQRATLHVTVRQNAPVSAIILHDRTEHIELLSRDTALLAIREPSGSLKDLTDFLAAWVTPYPPQLQTWLHSAAQKLPYPNSGFVGYGGAYSSSGIVDNVRAQARAIFQVLQVYSDIHYRDHFASQGVADDQITQRVQLPGQSLTIKLANCVDSSVLFASLLEAAAIDPVIVMIPEHTFVGWHINRGMPQYEFLETTAITREHLESFETAQEIAQDYFDQAQQAGDFERELFDPHGYARFMDIVRCRREGIYSLDSDWDRDTALSSSPHPDTVSRPQPQISVSRESHMTVHMTSLPTNLIDRYRKILLDSHICETAGALRSLFYGELSSYQPFLPDGSNEQDRANKLLAYLEPKTKQGRPVLLILLERLPSYMPDDDARSELDQLHRDMENA